MAVIGEDFSVTNLLEFVLHQFPIVRVDADQVGFVGRLELLWLKTENAIESVRPADFVRLYVPFPTAELGDLSVLP